jgi:Domain of unknown function (DUF4384)
MRAWLVLMTAITGFVEPPPAWVQSEIVYRPARIIEKAALAASAAVLQAPTPLPADADPDARTNNSAGVSVDVLPASYVQVGEKMTFHVSARKAGYLVLVDVDSEGKLSQIYPNMITLSDPRGIDANANFITPANSLTVPGDSAKTNFEFVAAPPVGVGMIVAILSDKPLQIVDLPDVPAALAGQPGAADFVRENARSLNVVSAAEGGQIKNPKWSITAKFYGIR